jgi:ferredoxin
VAVDFVRCRAHGLCAQELPEAVRVDEWNYPIVDGRPLPADLVKRAKAAANLCPVLALKVIRD